MADNKNTVELFFKAAADFDQLAEQAHSAMRKVESDFESGSISNPVGQAGEVKRSALVRARELGVPASQYASLGKELSRLQDQVRLSAKAERDRRGVARSTLVGAAQARSDNETGKSIKEWVKEQTAERKRNARGSRALADSDKYLTANAKAERNANLLAAQKSRYATAPKNLNAQVDAETAGAQLKAALDETRAGSETYRSALVNAATQANVLSAMIAEAKGASADYNASLILAATGAKRQAAAADEALASDRDYLEANARAATVAKSRAAAEQQAMLADGDYVVALRESIAIQKHRAQIEAEAAATEQNTIADANTKAAKRRADAATQAHYNTIVSPEEAGQTAATQARRKLAEQYETLAQKTQDDVQAEARLIVLKQQQARQLAEQVNQLQGRKAGAFQRLLFAAHGGGVGGGGGFGGGGTAADRPTLGQFAGRHVVNTLGYAVPGIAIGLGFEEISRSLQEAKKAQRAMAELEAEFAGLGQSDQFSGFANSIKQISSDTGVAVSEVVQLGIAMKGVYGSTEQATVATQAIAQATVTMGLSLQEAQQDLIGIAQGFTDLKSQGGSAMQSIQNELLHLQDLTGVEAKHLVPGIADVASTANAAGFGFNETASTVAAAAQHSGLSSATIGETLSKIITSLSGNPALRVQTESILGLPAAVSGGSVKSQIQAIMSGLSGLQQQGNSAEYSYVLGQLGINSSALPAANALSATGAEAAALAKNKAPGDRASQEFTKQMDTLSGRLDQLRSDFTNLGVAILNSPFGKLITEAAHGLGLFVNFLTGINHASGGVAGALLGVAAAGAALYGMVKAIQGVVAVMTTLKTATEVLTAVDEAQAVEKGASGILGGLTAVGGAAGGLLGIGELGGLGTAALGGGVLALGAAGAIGTAISVKKLVDASGDYNWGNYRPLGLGGPSGMNPPPKPPKHHNPNDMANAYFTYAQMDELSGLKAPTKPKPPKHHNPNDLANGLFTYAQMDLLSSPNLANLNGFTLSPSQATGIAALPKDPAALKAFGINSIENSDYASIPAAVQTGHLTQNQAIKALSGQADKLLSDFQANPSQPGWQAYLQSQQALNQQIAQQAQDAQQTTQAILANGDPKHNQALLAASLGILTAAIKSGDPSAIASAYGSYTSAIQQAYQTNAANAETGAGAISALTATTTLPNGQSFTGYLSNSQRYQYLNQDISANAALAQANAHEDPLAQAVAAKSQADAQMAAVIKSGESKNSNDYKTAQAASVAAAQQVTDQQNQIASAQDSLGKAYDTSAGDVLAEAKDDQKLAADALNAAHGKAAQLAAQAQQVAADREVVTAMNDIATAQAQLLTAMANATGDPKQIITAAKNAAATSLANANRIKQADQALHKDPNQDSAYTTALQQYYNDQANAASTVAQETISQTETLLFLGKETATQAIANLEAALPQVQGNMKATQSLLTEIRQIQNSASQNLNFDLPTTLFSSTLYQARAIEAGSSLSPASQGAPVSVTINVNGGSAASVNSAVSKLTSAVGGPQRTGTLGPLLNG